MKTLTKLYEQLCNLSYLNQCYKRARAGARKNTEVTKFFYNQETELIQLITELRTQTYEPSPYHYFEIHDPKDRVISVAAFRDRIVHHAVVGCLEAFYEHRFIYDSYATRTNKGVHAAAQRAQYFCQQNTFYLKIDIRKYFPSIVHKILLAQLQHHINDKPLMALLTKLIQNSNTTGTGLPIGNLTSQFFANIYLHELDLFIKQTLHIKHYLRYMDDMVFFDNDKQVLKNALSEIEKFIDTRLQLTLKPNATCLNYTRLGLSFLGYRIYRHKILMRTENSRRVVRKIQIKKHWHDSGKLSEAKFTETLNSYWAHLSYFGNLGLRKKICEKLNLN